MSGCAIEKFGRRKVLQIGFLTCAVSLIPVLYMGL